MPPSDSQSGMHSDSTTHHAQIAVIPGRSQTILVVPHFHQAEQGPDGTVHGMRDFEVWAALVSRPQLWDSYFPKIGEPTQGESLIYLEPGAQMKVIGGDHAITLEFHTDNKGRLSRVQARIAAENWEGAVERFRNALNPFLSALSWQYRVPLALTLVGGRDTSNHIMFQEYAAPPDVALFGGSSQVEVGPEFRAMYSYFREGMNSTSAAYRLLCFYKSYEVLQRIRLAYKDYLEQAGLPKSDLFRSTAIIVEASDFGIFVPNSGPLANVVGMTIERFMEDKVRPIRNKVAHILEDERREDTYSNFDDLVLQAVSTQISDVLIPVVRRFAERLRQFAADHPKLTPPASSTSL